MPEVPAVRSDDNPTKRQRQLIDRKIFAAVVMQVLTNMFDIEMLVQASWMSLASVTALRTRQEVYGTTRCGFPQEAGGVACGAVVAG
jgi:hypothetical protein